MATTADKQRTVVIALTLFFVLLIVAVSIWGPNGGNAGNGSAASVPTTVPFGPLGNGVATCEQRSANTKQSPNYVVIISAEEAEAKVYDFRVSLTAQDGSLHRAYATASDVTSARLAELALTLESSGDLSTASAAPLIFVDCRITGIQQDKRALLANN